MVDLIYPPRDELGRSHQPLTQGEWQVLDFFSDNLVGKGWEIYVQPHLNGLKPDFVILNPSVGVGVYEVKDWNLDSMSYWVEGEGNSARLYAKPKSRRSFIYNRFNNPFTKIREYHNRLYELYMPSLGQRGRDSLGIITAGAVFTAARRERVVRMARKFLHPGGHEDRFPVIGSDTLASGDISTALPMLSRSSSQRWFELGEDACRDLRGWLREPYLSLIQNFPLELSPKQRELSEKPPPEVTRQRRVRGPAGSGKSLVVCDRAARLAGEGKKVLVTGFNITLSHYLRDLTARATIRQNLPRNIVNQITFLHYHGWRNGIQSKFDKYDTILIDEGGDLQLDWHEKLRSRLAEDGEMFLATDYSQDLYDRSRRWTDERMMGAGYTGAWATLDISYRCPDVLIPRLRDLISFLAEHGVDYPADLPKLESGIQGRFGDAKLRWINVDNSNDPIEVCISEITSMMSDLVEDTAMPDIIFLTDHTWGSKIVSGLEHLGINVQHIFSDAASDNERQSESRARKMGFWGGTAKVKGCTIHSFKGWESRHLVVCMPDIPIEKAYSRGYLYHRAKLLYTAMTRLLRHENGSSLTVVCADKAFMDYGNSWLPAIS